MEQEKEFYSSSSSKEGISKGDAFFRTTNTDFAVAMLSVGVRPHKSGGIKKIKRRNGQTETAFILNAKSEDGTINCLTAHKLWKEGTGFFEKNPDDPLALVFCALQNRKQIVDVVKNGKTIIEFEMPDGMVAYVVEGSKKHKLLELKYNKK